MNKLISVNVKTNTIIGDLVPKFLKGLDRDSLINLQNALNDNVLEQLGLVNIEYWPEVDITDPTPWNKKIGTSARTLSTITKEVLVLYQHDNLTVAELAILKSNRKQLVYQERHARLQIPLILGNGMKVFPLKGRIDLMIADELVPTGSRVFTAINGTFVVGAGNIKNLFTEVDEYIQEFEDRGAELNQKITAANTQAQWDAIDVTADWPA